MKRFAVGIVSFLDNDLRLEFIEADNYIEALKKHSMISVYVDSVAWLNSLKNAPEEDLKTAFYESEMCFDIKEIKEKDQNVCPYCVIKEPFDSERASWLARERDKINQQNLKTIKGLSNETD